MPVLLYKIIGILLLAAAFGAQAVQAQAPSTDWSDWQVTLTPQALNPYLNFPGSSIRSLTMITVAGAQHGSAAAAKPYEKLYYTNTRVIGCQRLRQIGLTPGSGGVLQVMNASSDQYYPVANAILRMYVELYANRCITKYIAVPSSSFSGIVHALCAQGLVIMGPRAQPNIPGQHARAMIEIVSEPDGESEELLISPGF